MPVSPPPSVTNSFAFSKTLYPTPRSTNGLGAKIRNVETTVHNPIHMLVIIGNVVRYVQHAAHTVLVETGMVSGIAA